MSEIKQTNSPIQETIPQRASRLIGDGLGLIVGGMFVGLATGVAIATRVGASPEVGAVLGFLSGMIPGIAMIATGIRINYKR